MIMKRMNHFWKRHIVKYLVAAILITQTPVNISANELEAEKTPETAVLLTQEAAELYEGETVELEDSAPEGVVEILRDPEIDEKAGVAAEETGAAPAGEVISGGAEPEEGNEENAPGNITTWSELQSAINTAGTTETTITLEQDITADEGNTFLSIPQNARLTLDLKGHKLDRNLTDKSASENGCVIKLVSGTGSSEDKLTKLSIKDSSEAGTGLITGGNSSNPGGGVYVQANTLFTLESGTISGNTASNGGGVFVANSGTFIQTGGMICGNFATGNGGGVNCSGSFTMNGGVICDNESTGTGGGVSNSGGFTMVNGTICDNKANGNGGGVYNSGTFTMDDGTICDNEAIKNGGGVYNYGTLTMNGGTVCDNKATGSGGGVYDNKSFTMNGGAICRNTSIGANNNEGGGGVYIANATYADFSMTDGSIYGNTASGDGGGVCDNRTFTMTGGSISANHSERYGGGVYNKSTFNMNGGEIRDNSCDALNYGGGVYNINTSRCYISGNIAVSGNTASGAVNNVHLETGTTYVYLSSSISPGSSVGVTTANDPVNTKIITVTKDLSEKNAGDHSFLFSDKGFGVKLTDDGKEACLYLKPPQSINIVPSPYGTVTGKTEASPGETVVLTTTPDGGCSTESLSVNYTDDGGSSIPVQVTQKSENWIFTMPDREVTVSAVFKPGEWKSLDLLLAKGGTVKLQKDYAAGDTDTYLSISADNTVTLDLNGHTLNRNLSLSKPEGYVIKAEGNLIITDSSTGKNGSITGGWSTTFCGGVYVSGNGILTLSEGSITGNYGSESGSIPGGVFLGPGTSFTMNGGRISGNKGRIGGGVHTGPDASFIMNEGEIRENSATVSGGGVYLEPGASFLINGGQISGNTVYGSGGGVYIEPGASCSMNGGLIKKNTCGTSSGRCGGGVYNGGTFFLTAGHIRNNSTFMGGGIFNHGSLTIKGGSITGNTAYGTLSQSIGIGGGIYQDGLLTMKGGSITGNTSEDKGGGVYLSETSASMSVEGRVEISGNKTGSDDSNLFLSHEKVITLTGPMDEGSVILVSTSATPIINSSVRLTAGLSNNGFDTDFLQSDKSDYVVTRENDEAVLSLPVYEIEIDGNPEHGSVSADKVTAFEYEPITLTLNPDEKCILYELTVTFIDASGKTTELELIQDITDKNIYRFYMPKAPVKIHAVFGPDYGWNWVKDQVTNGGTVKLDLDIQAKNGDTVMLIPKGVSCTLDLNGHSLDAEGVAKGLSGAPSSFPAAIVVSGNLILKDSSGNGKGTLINSSTDLNIKMSAIRITDGGSFELKSGKISGFMADKGGAVLAEGGASFIMSGGIISGNASGCGGGVCIDGAVFIMTGGEITGNMATGSEYGGGVYFVSGNKLQTSAFQIKGSPVIRGNYRNDVESNFYLEGEAIGVTGALNGAELRFGRSDRLFAGAVMGRGTGYTLTSNDLSQFTLAESDSGYSFVLEGNSIKVKKVISYAKDIGPVTFTGEPLNPEVIVLSDSMGVVLTEGVDYTLSCRDNVNAGTATAVISGIGNYTGTLEKPFTILKSLEVRALGDVSKGLNRAGEGFGFSLLPFIPENAGTVSSCLLNGTVTKSGNVTVSSASVSNAGEVTLLLCEGAIGDTVTVPVKVVAQNYDLTFNLVCTLIECGHPSDKRERRGVKENNCSVKGYTGDLYCSLCETLLEKGQDIPIDPEKHDFDFENGTVIREATVYSYGGHTYCCRCNSEHTLTLMDIPPVPSKDGKEHTDLAEDTKSLSTNAALKVNKETEPDGSSRETVIIGGEKVSDIKTDRDGAETVETRVWIGGLKNSYHYTGTAIKPDFHVYDGTRKLTEKTDYTVSWKNNRDVGTATVTVRFKGNYKDSKSETVSFQIDPAVLGEDIEVHEIGVTAKKKGSVKVSPVLTWAATGKSVNSRYFDITPSSVTGEGTTEALITPKSGQKNYEGSAPALIKAVADKNKLLSNAKVTFKQKSYAYTGKPVEPEYSLSIGDRPLTENVDYRRVSLYNNTNPGTAVVVFEALNGDSAGIVGSRVASFKISGKIELKEQEPFSFAVSDGIYAKGGAKPAVIVKENGNILKEGRDYTLSYIKNKAVTNGAKTAEVKVTGRGNYKGSVTLKFAIAKQSLKADGITITVADQFTLRSKLKAPKITIIDADGRKLKANTDYTVGTPDASDPANTDTKGIVKVTIRGKGPYKDESIPVTYRYEDKTSDISKARIIKKIADKNYTGNEVKLSDPELTGILSVKDKTGATVNLLPGTHFRVTGYTNNVKRGTAKVTIQGVGDFAGTKTIAFKIVQKKVDYMGALIGGGWQ